MAADLKIGQDVLVRGKIEKVREDGTLFLQVIGKWNDQFVLVDPSSVLAAPEPPDKSLHEAIHNALADRVIEPASPSLAELKALAEKIRSYAWRVTPQVSEGWAAELSAAIERVEQAEGKGT